MVPILFPGIKQLGISEMHLLYLSALWENPVEVYFIATSYIFLERRNGGRFRCAI